MQVIMNLFSLLTTQLEISLILIISSLFFVLFLLSFLKTLRNTRSLRNIPISQIKAAAQGQIAITGQADSIPSTTTLAPLSNQPCCWFEYKLEEQLSRPIKHGVTDYYWQTLSEGKSQHPFLLRQRSDYLIISPIDAVIVCSQTLQQETYQLPEHLINKTNVLGKGSKSKRKFRLMEKRLTMNETIHILGYFKTFRPQGSEMIKAISQSTKPLKWQEASLSLIQKPLNQALPFIISTLQPQHLITRYKRTLFIHFILMLIFAILNCIFIDYLLRH